MPLIDDRGRVFGRLNLIDAMVAVVLLGLIPLAYGAFLLFRMPMPKITGVQPAEIVEGQDVTLRITGEDLRPFLYAMMGDSAYFSREFLLQSPTRAEVRLPPMAAGTYDLTLFDGGQIVARMPNAVTVGAPSGWLDLQAVGAFVGLSDPTAALIGTNLKFGPRSPAAEVLAVRPPEPLTGRVKIGKDMFVSVPKGGLRVPAIIRLSCAVTNEVCAVDGTAVAPGAIVTLPLATQTGRSGSPSPDRITFAVGQVFPAGVAAAFPAEATIRVRFAGEPGVLRAIKAGDVDVTGPVSEEERAVLVDVGSDQQATTAQMAIDGPGGRRYQVTQPATTMGTVRLPVVSTPSGWSYHGQLIKVGASFSFESRSAAVAGWVVDVRINPEKAGKK